MNVKKMKVKINQIWMWILVFTIVVFSVAAAPDGPTIVQISNSTKSISGGTMVNGTYNASGYAGGYIFVMNLSIEQQNIRWKAYVGNVSGKLVLDDANGYSVYEWSISTSMSGEVYATRASGAVSWGSVNCSTVTNITAEETAMSHGIGNRNDRILTTFNSSTNHPFSVGTVSILVNDCPTINTFVNDTAASNDEFEEILLNDGDNMLYTARIDDDQYGYPGIKDNSTYDFQMIVPEDATTGWIGSTAYYFYVEIE